MKKKPDHPDARVCPRCGYANATAFSVCRLCLIQLPAQQSIERPAERPVESHAAPTPPEPIPGPSQLEAAVPPISKPLPYRSPHKAAVSSTPEPIRHPRPLETAVPPPPAPVHYQSPPPLPPPPAPRRKKPGKNPGNKSGNKWGRKKWSALAGKGGQWIRAIILLPLSAMKSLQCRIVSLVQSVIQRRQQRSRLDRLSHSRAFLTRPTMAAVATRVLTQALSFLIAPIIFAGQKAAALKPRRPSWKPRLNFQMPRLNLRPALSWGREAFFFLAGLGGLVLKAALSALIFLLEQSHRFMKWLWRLLRSFKATKPAIHFDVWRVAKYGSGVLASLAVLVMLGLSFSTIQRSWASWRAAKTVTSEIKIQADYQSASRKTLVKLEPIQVFGEQFEGLTMGASFSYAGKSLKQQPASITLLLTSVASGFKYAKRHDLTARADGETIKLGIMNRSGQHVEILSDGKIEVVKLRKKGGSQSAHVLETLTINVPTKTWNKLSQSKEVKMKLGQTEFELTETHLSALRDMIERATPELASNQRSLPVRRSK